MAIALRTPRLLLREWRDGDVEPFAAMAADAEVMAMLPPLPDRAACEAWIGRMQARLAGLDFGYWAVELPGEASLIGAIGLSRVTFPAHFTPTVEIGWRLARRYWGQGYATEAARAVVEDGFFRQRPRRDRGLRCTRQSALARGDGTVRNDLRSGRGF